MGNYRSEALTTEDVWEAEQGKTAQLSVRHAENMNLLRNSRSRF